MKGSNGEWRSQRDRLVGVVVLRKEGMEADGERTPLAMESMVGRATISFTALWGQRHGGDNAR